MIKIEFDSTTLEKVGLINKPLAAAKFINDMAKAFLVYGNRIDVISILVHYDN